MNKENKILILSSIVLTGFIIAVFFHYILGFYLNTKYNTFLFDPNQFFGDFTTLLPKLIGFAPYSPPGEWQQYFPLSYLILTPFAYIGNKVIASMLFGFTFVSFFLYWNIKCLKCNNLEKAQNFRNILIISFLTYPFLYVLDRGNFDMIIFIFFTLFVSAFQRGKYTSAAILLGIVNSFKPFSFLFPVIFLFEKKYKEFFLCIGTTFLFVMGGFLIFKGNIFDQLSVLFQSWVWAKKTFILKANGGMNNSSSLFMALKWYFCYMNNIISPQALDKICHYANSIITLFITFFAWKEKVFWKRITLLTLYMLTIPAVVFDYKLIFIFVPIWLFLNAEEKSKFDLIYLILFGLILIPKKYFIFGLLLKKMYLVIFSVWFNPIIMLTFMGLIIAEQFLRQKKEDINGKT